MSIFERIILGALVLVAVSLVLLIPYSIKKQGEWEQACKDAGGIPYWQYKSKDLCINPSAIIEVD